jgi:hypothetical protein
VLDISRGIFMSVVEGKQYIPETPRLMQCCLFAGAQYTTGVIGNDTYLRMWPRLLVQATANGREVSSRLLSRCGRGRMGHDDEGL